MSNEIINLELLNNQFSIFNSQLWRGLNTILKIGTGADRQLEVFRKTGEMNAVVDYLIENTLSGLRRG